MDEPGQQLPQSIPGSVGMRDEQSTVVVHVTVQPGTLRTWRLCADATLQVHGARIWVTRTQSPYDFWLDSHAELRLRRGERIWVSVDGNHTAHMSLTSYVRHTRGAWAKWLGWLADIAFDLLVPRPR
ncbi:DUF2917 domain-containing protein [Paraburkholderia phosphatilytica]|uniref:DUF2917 domain-containing protein n=1 Tax=Paraburkholderia phosphatilytica TaxID=2282883 RepID=UPI000E4B3CDB|nr:DUF2917 domain-containing protein [Paraburkholderia phosphatilytica]